MKKLIVTSFCALIIGVFIGYGTSEIRRPRIYYIGESQFAPSPMEDEDYADPRQIVFTAQGIAEKRLTARLLEKLGPNGRVKLVWSGYSRYGRGMIEVVGGRLSEQEINDATRQSIAEGFEKAKPVFEKKVEAWKKGKQDQSDPTKEPSSPSVDSVKP